MFVRTRVLALLCVFAPLVCFAQTPEEVRRDAQVHLGPFYVTPRFAVKEFGVDTNVFNTANAASDFTFTFAPSARVSTPFGRRAVVTTKLGTDLVYYQRYASERSINPDVGVRTELFLGRVEPFFEASYLRTRQRPEYEIDARLLREERRLKVGARVKLSSRTSLELSTDEHPVDFGSDASINNVSLREVLNRTTTTRSVEGRYELTPLTTVILRTEAATDRFDYASLRDADSTSVIPGVEFKPRALVSGSARVGLRRFTPLNDALAPFSGAVANAALSYTLRGATKFTVAVDRDLTYSYERVQPYFVTDSFGVTVRRQIVGRVDAVAALQRQRHSYRDLLLPGATQADLNRVDTTRSYSASVGYRIGGTMRAGVGTIYRQRASTSSRFLDYQGFRFVTTVDYDF